MEKIKAPGSTLQDKFTTIRLLLTEIEDECEKIAQREIDLQQLKLEFEDHEKYHKKKP
jgi:hypothetical protein